MNFIMNFMTNRRASARRERPPADNSGDRPTTPPSGNRRLKWWFNISIAVGGAIVLATWKLNTGPWLTIGGPIAVMAIYVAVTSNDAKHPSLHEQIADSWYYLGFIFTLVALAVSLFDFAVSVGQAAQAGLLSRIGVSLTTSIFGLGCRLVSTQFGTPEQRSQDAVEMHADAIIASVRDTQGKLSAASEEFCQVLQRQTTAFRDAFDANAKGFDVKSALRGLVGTFEEALADCVDEMKAANRRINESVIKSGDQHAARLEKLSEANQKMYDVAVATFEKGLSDIMNSLRRQAAELDIVPVAVRGEVGAAIAQLIGEVERLKSALVGARGASGELVGAIGPLTGHLVKLADVSAGFDGLAGRLAEADGRLAAVNRSAETLGAAFDQIPPGARAAFDGFLRDLDNLAQLRAAMQREMENAAKLIAETILRLSQGMDQLSRTIEDVARDNAATGSGQRGSR